VEPGRITVAVSNINPVRSFHPVRVLANGRNVGGDAYLSTSVAVRDPALIGVVAPGATVIGVVAIPLAQALRRHPLALEIAMPNGRSIVRANRGIELR
jgi:hypothetical protein